MPVSVKAGRGGPSRAYPLTSEQTWGSDATGMVQDLSTYTQNQKWVNVLDPAYGADPTGAADSTAAVALAYAVIASSGGELYFPAGTYKFNLTVVNSSIRITGDGRSAIGSTGGTSLKPYSPTAPCVKVGDGIAKVTHTSIAHLSFVGDNATGTQDLFQIHGASHTLSIDVSYDLAGRDNIVIDASATQPTYYTVFSGCFTRAARGSSLKATQYPGYPTSYVVGVYWLGGNIEGGSNTGARSFTLTDAELGLSNVYCQSFGTGGARNRGGAYIVSNGVLAPHVYCFDVNFDSDNDLDQVLEFSVAKARVSDYVVGMWVSHCKAKWASGTDTDLKPMWGAVQNTAMLNFPSLTGALTLCSQDSVNTTEDPSGTQAQLSALGANDAARAILVSNAALRGLFNSARPIQSQAGGAVCMWVDAAGMWRQYRGAYFPPSDTAGVPLGPKQCGTINISAAATSGAVTLPVTESDTNYRIAVTAGTAGSPAAGSMRASWSGRLTTGFTVNLEAAPGGAEVVEIGWQIFRV